MAEIVVRAGASDVDQNPFMALPDVPGPDNDGIRECVVPEGEDGRGVAVKVGQLRKSMEL